jgi:hypothetical protein
MSKNAPTKPACRPRYVQDLPLSDLLIALDYAERVAGPDSSTVRVLARIVQERLRGQRPPNPDGTGGGGHA